MVSWIWDTITSGNGLLLIQNQAISWINVNFLPIGPQETISVKFESQHSNYLQFVPEGPVDNESQDWL